MVSSWISQSLNNKCLGLNVARFLSDIPVMHFRKPPGFISGLLLLLVCVRGITDWWKNSCLTFADNVKLLRTANSKPIQMSLGEVYKWPVRWISLFSLSRCPRLMKRKTGSASITGPSEHQISVE